MRNSRPVLASGVWCPPADPAALARLVAESALPLPDDYLAFLADHNGGEVHVGQSFVFFWKAEQVLEFNRRYEVELYAPGLFLFASDGCGDAYGLDLRPGGPGAVVVMPFVGMNWSRAEYLAPQFALILVALAQGWGLLDDDAANAAEAVKPLPSEAACGHVPDHHRDRERRPGERAGAGPSAGQSGTFPNDDPGAVLEYWAVRPLLLGGSGSDPANSVWLPRDAHIDMVCFWNSKIRKMDEEQVGLP